MTQDTDGPAPLPPRDEAGRTESGTRILPRYGHADDPCSKIHYTDNGNSYLFVPDGIWRRDSAGLHRLTNFHAVIVSCLYEEEAPCPIRLHTVFEDVGAFLQIPLEALYCLCWVSALGPGARVYPGPDHERHTVQAILLHSWCGQEGMQCTG